MAIFELNNKYKRIITSKQRYLKRSKNIYSLKDNANL